MAGDTQAAQHYEFKAEMKQLLHLIIHSLYTHREIFLRELISNASDAINKVRTRQLNEDVRDHGAEPAITISVDEDKKTISIADNGIGMTREELIANLGTIARSGTLEFLRQAREAEQSIDGNLIGQFGVGFYSVFMVTDSVTVETLSAAPQSEPWRWSSDGSGSFAIEAGSRDTRGTTITFTLRDDAEEFASAEALREVVEKYSNFIATPIHINGEEVKRVPALWQRSKDAVTTEELNELYTFVSKDWREPLGHLHLSIEGAVSFKSILFVPNTPPSPFDRPDRNSALQLYVNRVMIQEECKDLLPDWLNFVRGVVDTEDLPLNVSREQTQNSPVMARIQKSLVGKLLGMFEDWATGEAEKFDSLMSHFGPALKIGLVTDSTYKPQLTELLRFTTTKGEKISLKQYKERMAEGQDKIFYIAGDTMASVQANPNLEWFKARNIEVLLLGDPVDAYISSHLGPYDSVPVVSIDAADLELDDVSADGQKLDAAEAADLVLALKDALADRVEDVVISHRLVESPVSLVAGKQSMDRAMERMMRAMDKSFTGSKRIMELNTAHPLVRNLSSLHRQGKPEEVKAAAHQLMDAALLLEGALESPADLVRRMFDFMTKATS